MRKTQTDKILTQHGAAQTISKATQTAASTDHTALSQDFFLSSFTVNLPCAGAVPVYLSVNVCLTSYTCTKCFLNQTVHTGAELITHKRV